MRLRLRIAINDVSSRIFVKTTKKNMSCVESMNQYKNFSLVSSFPGACEAYHRAKTRRDLNFKSQHKFTSIFPSNLRGCKPNLGTDFLRKIFLINIFLIRLQVNALERFSLLTKPVELDLQSAINLISPVPSLRGHSSPEENIDHHPPNFNGSERVSGQHCECGEKPLQD